MTQNSFDVAVIGAGAAGLNAALILGQARRSVIVFDNGSPRNAAADHMNGFLSRDGMNPAELLTIGRGEVRKFGGEFHDGTVVSVTRDGEKFSVELAGVSKIQVRKVLVSTGLTDRLPVELEVFGERWGRDVLHCPYCHGYGVRDQPLGVIAKNREKLAARGISIVEGEVAGPVVEDDRLVGVRLADGSVVARSAVFVGGALTMDPNDAILRAFGAQRAETMMGDFVT
eukprot:gene24782-29732_t